MTAAEQIQAGQLVWLDPPVAFFDPLIEQVVILDTQSRARNWELGNENYPVGVALADADTGEPVDIVTQDQPGQHADGTRIGPDESRAFRLRAGRDIAAGQSVMIDQTTRLVVPSTDPTRTVADASHAAKANEFVDVLPMPGHFTSASSLTIDPAEFKARVGRLAALQNDHAGIENNPCPDET